LPLTAEGAISGTYGRGIRGHTVTSSPHRGCPARHCEWKARPLRSARARSPFMSPGVWEPRRVRGPPVSNNDDRGNLQKTQKISGAAAASVGWQRIVPAAVRARPAGRSSRRLPNAVANERRVRGTATSISSTTISDDLQRRRQQRRPGSSDDGGRRAAGSQASEEVQSARQPAAHVHRL
jgi:hypothetical protein